MLGGVELLEEIVIRLGGEPPDGARRPKLVRCFERELSEIAGRGKIPMVVVDDAQNLSPGLLEELRLLVNAAQQVHQPMEVLLVGLPALEALLDHPTLGALRQRVSVRARIEPLSAAETRRYLRHRVGAVGGDGANMFPRRTCVEIASLSGGVPRQINALASELLGNQQGGLGGVVLQFGNFHGFCRHFHSIERRITLQHVERVPRHRQRHRPALPVGPGGYLQRRRAWS